MSAGGWRARLDPLPASPLPGGLHVHVARRPAERRRGLARLDDLDPRHALRLEPCRAVHTFGMRFPLDLIWLARDGAVRPRRPRGARSPPPAVPAGALGGRDARG